MNETTPKAVMITGASSGIGHACTTYLAGRGFQVYAGVRRDEDAERLQSEDTAIHPVRIDVTDETAVAQAVATIAAATKGHGLAGLVNNAGIAVAGPLEYLDSDDLRRQLEVNVIGVQTATRAFLPLLRAGQGRIVNMGSVSGYMVYPLVGPYAASKHALAALSIALRLELAPWKIPVSLIEPGVIRTAIWDKTAQQADAQRSTLPPEAEDRYGPLITFTRQHVDRMAQRGIPPERVARTVHRALTARRPKARYPVGLDAWAQLALVRCIPERIRLAAFGWGLRYMFTRR